MLHVCICLVFFKHLTESSHIPLTALRNSSYTTFHLSEYFTLPPSFFPPGALWLPVPSGLGRVKTFKQFPYFQILPYSQPTHFTKTKRRTHLTKTKTNTWYLVPLKVKLPEGPSSLLSQVFPICICIFLFFLVWGFWNPPCFFKHGACIICVVLPSMIWSDFSTGGTSLFCKPCCLPPSCFNFLIIDWIHVTRWSKELSLGIPDPLHTFFFLCHILLHYLTQMRAWLDFLLVSSLVSDFCWSKNFMGKSNMCALCFLK